MTKIETSSWKTFLFTDYFELERNSNFPSIGKIAEGACPVVTAKGVNQGIAKYGDVEPIYENMLTVSMNGEGAGSVFYHDYPFAFNCDCGVIKQKFKLSRNVGLFVATVLRTQLSQTHDFSNKPNKSTFKTLQILLPATESGEPDWAYMESYIVKIEAEVLNTKEIIQRQIASKKSSLAPFESWKTFKIGDFFTAHLSKDDIQRKHLIEGTTPLVSAGKTSNGITAYIQSDTAHLWEKGMLTVDMFGKAFYQPDPFFAVSHGRVIILVPNEALDEKPLLFIASILNIIGRKYEFAEMATGKKLLAEEIPLPVNEDGTPDWDYMESYIERRYEQNI